MIRSTLSAAAVCLMLAGCGVFEAASEPTATQSLSSVNREDLPDHLQDIAPTETPTATISAQSNDVPDDWREVGDDTFSLWIPPDFTESSEQVEGGTQYSYLWDGAEPGEEGIGVVVRTQERTVQSAIESSYINETLQQMQGIEIHRSWIEWPGADQVVLLQWEETVEGQTVPRAFWELFVNAPSGQSFSLAATAPADSMEESDLRTVVESLTIR